MTTDAIRDAASVILWRAGAAGPEVLMGRRGERAAFMASKFVFPGGAVDPSDHLVGLSAPLADTCRRRLLQEAPAALRPEALAAAAIRELQEETGLALAASGGAAMRFVFRAITPPGRTRRFDARFFLISVEAATGDTATFAEASDELSDLQWIGPEQARRLDLPFITEVVLAEVGLALRGAVSGDGVPFFDNRTDRPTFRRLV